MGIKDWISATDGTPSTIIINQKQTSQEHSEFYLDFKTFVFFFFSNQVILPFYLQNFSF